MTGTSEAERVHSALISAHAALYPHLSRSRVERRSGYDFLICPSISIPQFNGVWAEEDDGGTVADLASAIADVEQAGIRFWLQTREGRHPAVEAEAGRLGLTQTQQMPGMVATPADLNDLPETWIAIERVSGTSGLAEAQEVSESGFAAPPGRLVALYTGLATAPGFSVYVGRVDGTAAATSVAGLVGDMVGIFAVATHPDHRRRGYGAAVTLRAVSDAMTQGAQLAWLQSSQMGEGVYRRMGFRCVETYKLFSRV